ncbi:hypothetical protein G4V62_02875 [Bacillaceae bacterium SIJ1]|uniref:hypothetical protein n=1 Tax=Litoribacterium kuwaitense TaxID=1398745 RepID=UPI0013E9AB1E|nr:hypothetical protein [Litoribacterium kuwaitense]NGP43942.1 hypothetical protein [Litoribacterium kuwaitense]
MDRVYRMGIVLLLGLAVYFAYVIVQFPLMGLTISNTPNGDYQIAQVVPGEWGQAHRVEEGSMLLEINGKPPEAFFPLNWSNRLEKVHRLRVQESDGDDRMLTPSRSHLQNQMIFHLLLPVSFFLFCLFLGWQIYVRKHHLRVTRLLIFLTFVIGLFILSAPVADREDLLGRLTYSASSLLIPILFLQFFRRYFRSHSLRFLQIGHLSLLYGAMVGSCGMEILSFIRPELDGTVWLIQFTLFVLFTNWTSFVLIANYIHMRKTAYHTTLKVILSGFFLSLLPFVLFTAIPAMITGLPLINVDLTSLAILFLPASFIYLMVTERLLDMNYIFYRLRYYALLALMPTGFVMFSTYLFQGTDVSPTLWLVILLSTYGSTLLFLYMKEWLDYKLQFKRFSEKYNYQKSLYRFSQKVKQVKKVQDLITVLQNELEEVLHVRETAVFSMDREGDIVCEEKPHLKTMIRMSKNKWARKAYLPGDALECIDGFALVIGMKQNAYTMLWISSKTDRSTLSPDEKQWQRALSYYTSILLENLYLIENLIDRIDQLHEPGSHPAWLSKMLFTISERERSRLANDLHDTILQEQLFLYRKLDTLRNTIPMMLWKVVKI